MFDKEHEITGNKAKIAQGIVEAISKILLTGVEHMDQPGEKVALICGAALAPLGAFGIIMTKNKEDGEAVLPAADDLVFACCYIIASAEDANRDGVTGIAMGFSLEYVDKALDIYHNIMKRHYDNLHPFLVKAINLMKREAVNNIPVHMKQFLPE